MRSVGVRSLHNGNLILTTISHRTRRIYSAAGGGPTGVDTLTATTRQLKALRRRDNASLSDVSAYTDVAPTMAC
jgi:hypothetical protein